MGSGKNFRLDCWNVDINPKWKPDLVCDMRKLECQNEIFTEVLAKDCLVYLTVQECRVLLRKILGWLKPNGVLRIHLPNLDGLVEILYKSEDEDLRHEALKWMYGTDGIGATDYESNKLRWAYTEKSLTKMLEGVGFKILSTQITCDGFGLSVDAQKC